MELSVKLLLVLLAALTCLSCQDELHPPKPRLQTIVWKAVGSWSGRGSRQTDSFDMSIFHWRVHWKTANESTPGKGHFVLTVNTAVSGRPLEEIVCHDGPGEGYADVNDDPRCTIWLSTPTISTGPSP